jgi:hypothetical protein
MFNTIEGLNKLKVQEMGLRIFLSFSYNEEMVSIMN